MQFYIVAALALLSGVQAAGSESTTITCSGCPPASTAPDMVTRSALPSSSCTAKALTVVTNTGTAGGNGAAMPTGGSMPASTPTASVVPVNGANGNMGNVGGVLVIAAAAVGYML
ncbi:hypothetical protein FZEAL_3883 [Fusarium zealandicum]|uniref:Uncharacterized protein n=1 Tax=Fusarium zealandicum TaxID=1053134 RepID=A0A8H4UMT6_9HYPO|nr:hypothetical protein FZEAL_3883 [Fusarium zealandicum]